MTDEKAVEFYWSMPDGTVWKCDARRIASARADYYASKVDGYAQSSKEWEEEYKYALEHDDELVDWAVNNMGWRQLNADLILPERRKDYAKLFNEAQGFFTLDEAMRCRDRLADTSKEDDS